MKINPVILFLLLLIINFFVLYPFSISLWNHLYDRIDALLNTWILRWVQHQIINNPLKLFDANIFYPYKNTLAYSEHLFLPSLITAPVFLITKNPIFAHNFYLILSLILTELLIFLFIKKYTNSNSIGLICSLFFTFSPLNRYEFARIQIVNQFWFILAIIMLFKTLKEDKLKNWLFFTIIILFQMLSGYYIAFFTILTTFVFTITYFFFFRENSWKKFIKYIISILIGVLITTPLILPYVKLNREFGFSRTINECIKYSADLLSLIAFNNRFISDVILILDHIMKLTRLNRDYKY